MSRRSKLLTPVVISQNERIFVDGWLNFSTFFQTHLVCTVPAFKNVEIKEPVNAKICVISGNRTSEPHSFTYTPLNEMLSSSANSTAAESTARAANAEIASNADVDAGTRIDFHINPFSNHYNVCISVTFDHFFCDRDVPFMTIIINRLIYAREF